MTKKIETAAQLDPQLVKQVADWRREVARLQDLINYATGAEADAAQLDLDNLEALARAATPQDFDSAQITNQGYIECPTCDGSGDVELTADYCNYDGCALGVQFYGIGPEHLAAEAFYRTANPATILALIAQARAQPAAAPIAPSVNSGEGARNVKTWQERVSESGMRGTENASMLADITDLRAQLAQQRQAMPHAKADELNRAADMLTTYHAHLHRLSPINFDEHPYLPSIEEAAEDLRALATAPAAPHAQAEPVAKRASMIEFALRQIIEADDVQALTDQLINFGRAALAAPAPQEAEQAALLAARAEGRAEALEILTGLCAETGLEDYTGWGKSGAPEDEGSAYWEVEKLRDLFKCDDKLHNMFDRAESMYWRAKGEKDEAEREMRMVKKAPFYKPLSGFLSKHQAYDLMADLKQAPQEAEQNDRAAYQPDVRMVEMRLHQILDPKPGTLSTQWHAVDALYWLTGNDAYVAKADELQAAHKVPTTQEAEQASASPAGVGEVTPEMIGRALSAFNTFPCPMNASVARTGNVAQMGAAIKAAITEPTATKG